MVSHLTIQHWLAYHAQYRGSHTALIYQDQQWTYAELYREVMRMVASWQAAGIQRGDKVATLLGNSPELYQVYWACATMGTVAVPLSPLLRGSGLSNLIGNADTTLVITTKNLLPYLREADPELSLPAKGYWLVDGHDADCISLQSALQGAPEPQPVADLSTSDLYNIIYSSGTTGLPKGIMISHGCRALYGTLFANCWRMTPESIVMHSGSIIFNGSFLTLMPAMYLGCTYVLLDHFDPVGVVNACSAHGVTHTILVPSQIIQCLQHQDFHAIGLPSLQYVLSVGAPLPVEHKRQLNELLPNVFYELYGLTEGFMTILDRNETMRKMGSVGIPGPFMQIAIVNETGERQPDGVIGEIIGTGPLLMDGYYKNEAQTKDALRNGWLFTGDLGYLDEDGFLHLTGRKKDLIISGGVNIYPVDIEEIVSRHPSVAEVAVLGMPHDQWGETPVAAVVTRHQERITDKELLHWVNDRIEARFQKVTKLVLLPFLPRNVAGKVLKHELRSMIEA